MGHDAISVTKLCAHPPFVLVRCSLAHARYFLVPLSRNQIAEGEGVSDQHDDDDHDEPRDNLRASEEYQALIKLARAIRTNKITIFDDNEAKALKRVAAIYMALDTIGALATFIRNFLIAVGLMVAAYTALKLGFLDWIKSGNK